MINAIRTLYNEPEKNRKLFLAGHSLGGALATVAAARLVFEEDMHVAGMYTIGSPRLKNGYHLWQESLAGVCDCHHLSRRIPRVTRVRGHIPYRICRDAKRLKS